MQKQNRKATYTVNFITMVLCGLMPLMAILEI